MFSMSLRMGALVAVMLAALQLALGWASYSYVTRRCDRLLDSELRFQANALRDVSRSMDSTSMPAPTEQRIALEHHAEPRAEAGFQYWGSDNTLHASSRDLQNVALDALPPGFANFSIEGKRWRALTELDGGRWIRVAQRSDVRQAIGRSTAVQAALLFGIGTPILIALMMWILGRGLAPIRSLAEQIGRCEPGRSGPIGPGELPREFEPIVASVNGLLARCGAVAARNVAIGK
jgi:two-component system sensor histidine kinase QseC